MINQLRLIFDVSRRESFGEIIDLLGLKDKYLNETYYFGDDIPTKSASDFARRINGSFNLFLNLVNSNFRSILFPKTIQASLAIHIERNLASISYMTPDKNIKLRIQNPVLILPCNCNLPDEFRGGACPIHSTKVGREIYELFLKGVVLFEFDDIVILYKKTNSLWPPNIDSIYLLYLIKKKNLVDSSIKSILDLGSGTGILGIYLFYKFDSITQLYFSDIFLTPIYTSIFNTVVNASRIKNLRKKLKIRGFISDVYSNIPNNLRFDIVVSNPPYLPKLGASEASKFSVIFDNYIIKKLIIDSKQHTKMLIFLSSSISYARVKEILDIFQDRYGFSFEILDRKLTPLKFPQGYNAIEYIRKLIESKRKYLTLKKDDPFGVWHTVYYFLINY